MKKLLLMTAIFAAIGTTTSLIASHWCVCQDDMKKGQPVRNAVEVDCNNACGKGKWTGRAQFSNSAKLKGIVCSCIGGKSAKIECDSFRKCGRKWAKKVYSTAANAKNGTNDINVPEGDETVLETNGSISMGY